MYEKIYKGFKVVSVSKDDKGRIRYHSALSITYKRYYTGKFIRRDQDKGGLALFNSLCHAQAFLRGFFLDHEDRIIFECEYTKTEYPFLSYNLHNNCRGFLPAGTVFAEKVKLLRRVK